MDRWLIDGVAQPFSVWLYKRTGVTPWQVAAWCQSLGVPTAFGYTVASYVEDGSMAWGMLGVVLAALIWASVVPQLVAQQTAWLSGQEITPLWRGREDAIYRVFMLVLAVLEILPLLWLFKAGLAFTAAQTAAWMLAMTFGACILLPGLKQNEKAPDALFDGAR